MSRRHSHRHQGMCSYSGGDQVKLTTLHWDQFLFSWNLDDCQNHGRTALHFFVPPHPPTLTLSTVKYTALYILYYTTIKWRVLSSDVTLQLSWNWLMFQTSCLHCQGGKVSKAELTRTSVNSTGLYGIISVGSTLRHITCLIALQAQYAKDWTWWNCYVYGLPIVLQHPVKTRFCETSSGKNV
jgi:hypothetical protein